jgi:hypothetical protein
LDAPSRLNHKKPQISQMAADNTDNFSIIHPHNPYQSVPLFMAAYGFL